VLNSTKNVDQVALTKETCRSTIFITYSCAFILIILGRYLIKGVYGAEFAPAIVPFSIILIGTAAGGITKTIRSYFYSAGKPQVNTKVAIIMFVITPFVLKYFIGNMGLVGAAIGTATIYLLTAALLLGLFIKTTNATLRETLFIKKSDIKFYYEKLAKNLFVQFKNFKRRRLENE
jgi:O-antigen/teichoic acid export membrane protein